MSDGVMHGWASFYVEARVMWAMEHWCTPGMRTACQPVNHPTPLLLTTPGSARPRPVGPAVASRARRERGQGHSGGEDAPPQGKFGPFGASTRCVHILCWRFGESGRLQLCDRYPTVGCFCRETGAFCSCCRVLFALVAFGLRRVVSAYGGTALNPHTVPTLFSSCGCLARQDPAAEARSESVAEARSVRRQRKLDQVEIPEDHLFITGELLGKGGFGEVYLADYNGHNAAAKVWNGIALLGHHGTNVEWRDVVPVRGTPPLRRNFFCKSAAFLHERQTYPAKPSLPRTHQIVRCRIALQCAAVLGIFYEPPSFVRIQRQLPNTVFVALLLRLVSRCLGTLVNLL